MKNTGSPKPIALTGVSSADPLFEISGVRRKILVRNEKMGGEPPSPRRDALNQTHNHITDLWVLKP